MKKIDLTQKEAKNSPQGGVLVGKKEGQTIIYDDGKVGGWFVGKTHKEGGIQGIDKTTGQPIEVQTGEVIITAPALADQTPRQFEGKMMTNREILSKINSDAGGVALAEDGMEISNKALYKGGQYNYGGKMMSDKDIFDEINKCGCEHEEKNNLSEGMSLEDIAKKHNVSLDDLHKQVEIGMKDESIHAGDYKDHFNIVKDHLVESPTFYTDEQKAQGETKSFSIGGLVAPNGKPSGLYFTEVYNLVRTKEFKEWFGDWEEAYKTKDYDGVSKIIDENGEPLICVHNSPNEFFEFDEYKVGSTTDAGYYGKGFYFFPNVGFDKYGEIEYNCFLNIKNPYFKQSSHRNYELKSDELKNEGFDGVVVYPNFNEDFNFENGVDKAEEIVAYYSEQIKLGDGTNTTFDKYNNDIRFDDGGMFNTESFLNYYFEEIAEFLKNQNDIVLNKDFTFKFKGENFKIEPLIKSRENVDEAIFFILDYEDEVVGTFEFNPKNKKQFNANSNFFNWENYEFKKGGEVKENLVKDAKEGNTPARDLNNYNDMLDIQADGKVGGNTGIDMDGAYVGDASGDVGIFKEGGEVGADFTFLKSNPMQRARAITVLEKKIRHDGNIMSNYEFLEGLPKDLEVGVSKLHSRKTERGYVEKLSIGNFIVDAKAEIDYYKYLQANGYPYSKYIKEVREAEAKKNEADKIIRDEQQKIKELKDIENHKNSEIAKKNQIKELIEKGADTIIKRMNAPRLIQIEKYKTQRQTNDVKQDIDYHTRMIEQTERQVNSAYKIASKLYEIVNGEVQPKFNWKVGDKVKVEGYLNHAPAEIGTEIVELKENRFGELAYRVESKEGIANSWISYDGIYPMIQNNNTDYTWDTTFTSGFNKGQKLSEQEIETIDVYNDFIYGLLFKSGGSFDAKTEETIGLLSITNNPVNLAVILEKDPSGFNTNAIQYNQKIKRRLHNLAEKSNRKIVLNNNSSSRINRQFPYLLVSENDAENYDLATEFYEKLETPRKESRKKLIEEFVKNGLVEQPKENHFEVETKTQNKELGKELTPTISNWNDVPSIWKNTSKVKKVTWSNNPYDKGLYSIVAPFLGEDKLRPIMTGINFDENGITCTDAHLLITLPYPNKEFEGVYNADLSKKKDSEQITIDGKYPNYSAVIPKSDDTTPYLIDVYKLLQYTKVAINYANKTTFAIQYKLSDGIYGMNGRFLIEVLNTLLKLGHEKVYAHFSGFSRAMVFSPTKDYELGNDELLLAMPVMVQNKNLGALDLDYNRELSVYYDFNDNEIHNADGSVAEFRMTYENNAVVSKEDVKLFEDMIKKSKNRLAILDYVKVEDSVARSTNLYSEYELKGVNLPNGIYKADKGTLEITMEAIEDFPTKPIYEMDENTIQFVIPSPVLEYYLDKLKFVVGKDDLRPVMMGVCFHHTSDNKLYLASTDAHILLKIDITKYVDMPIYNKDIKTIINPKSIYDFLNTIEESALHIKSNRIATKIDSEKWSLYSRNIDGNFPNYDAVIPRESNKLLSIDLEQLRKCIDSDFTKKYERESNNKDGIFIFNKKNEIYIATDIGYREKKIEGIEKLCETNVDSKTQEHQYRDENILLIMPVTYGEQTNFCFGKRILQRVINIVNDKKLEIHYSEFNRAYLVKIDSFVYEKTTKEHKIKEQKLTQKNLEQIAELEDLKEVLEPTESADNNELNEAIETLEILLESAKGKDKKEIKEAIEILKMLK